MKFLYEYRTPDNAKHNGVISASDREAAYALLKKQGIKPSRFAEAPGFFNKLFGKGKRWLVIGVLGVGCLVLGAVVYVQNKETRDTDGILDSGIRRQLIGDVAVIEKGIRTGWADVFTHEGDRFLASFAIPGAEPAVRSTTKEKLKEALDAQDAKHTAQGASLEARQIIAIVEGMKQELRDFIASGGSIRQYGNLLVDRHEREMEYYRRAKREVDSAVQSGMMGAAVMALWEKRNASLRKLGIKPIPMPE